MNYTKTVLKTILYTFLSLLLAFAVLVGFMLLVFTKTSADILYDLGCENWASSLYYKSYQKSGDIYTCYKALNIKIKLDKHSDVITYFQSFISDDEYEEFLSVSNENYLSLNIGLLEKSTLLNEENYLYGKYVSSLLAVENTNHAWDVALEKFTDYDNWTLQNQGVYSLGLLINNNAQEFDKVYEGFDSKLIEEMQEYFDDCIIMFDSAKDTTDMDDQAYLVALGNRIVNVGNNINYLYSSLSINDTLMQENINNMKRVNDVIKGIL